LEEKPFDPLAFCSRGLRVGKCYSSPNLCLFNHRDQQVEQLTDYIGYDEDATPTPNTLVVESEVVRDFALTPDCSKVVYYTSQNIFQPLTPDPEGEMDSFSNPLHMLTIASGEDHVILDDVDSYLLNPAGDKLIILYRQEKYGDLNVMITETQDNKSLQLTAEAAAK